MNESPFGSVSPGWPGIPFTAWQPIPSPVQGGRAGSVFGSPSGAMQATPVAPGGFRPAQTLNAPAGDFYTIGGAPTWFAQPGHATGYGFGFPINLNPYTYAGPYPGVLPPVAPAPTISTLLTSVAIRRGQPSGPTSDQEVEDFIYDVLELVPGTNEVEVRSESGKVTLTGTVQHKRLKHDVGEIVWAIPNVGDVQNNVTITTRRRARAGGKEHEQTTAAQSRRQP
jgi:BON domain-containing protein